MPCRDGVNQLPKLKPLQSFPESKNDASNQDLKPARTTQSKTAANAEAPGNKAGQWQGCRWREGIDMTKSCWWGAHQRLGRENQTDLVPFWPSLSSHLYIHVLLSWSYQRMLYVLCWFAAATQNILDMSPANHYSEGFNSLENEDILTMNYNSFGLKTEMIHADIFKDPRVNSA